MCCPGSTRCPRLKGAIIHFIILAAEDDTHFGHRTDATESGPYWASWSSYVQAITDGGVLVSAGGLQPPGTATTVRIGDDGSRLVQDGPYADTKEQLGGFFVIDVPDLDAALDWAARCPSAAYGSVEVRPLLPPMP